jgi:hypothetical protein
MPKVDFEFSALSNIGTTRKMSAAALSGLPGNKLKTRSYKWRFENLATLRECFLSIHSTRDAPIRLAQPNRASAQRLAVKRPRFPAIRFSRFLARVLIS